MLADGLIKQLNKEQFKDYRKRIGMKNVTN